MSDRLPHDRRVLLLALGAGAPAVAVSTWWMADALPTRVSLPLGLLIYGAWIGLSMALQRQVIRPLATLSSLLAGVREGDFSVRARGADRGDALGITLREINALADTLREQRLDALEATALLRTVMDEIDVAIFAFDDQHFLRLVNGAGERLFGRPARRLLNHSAEEIGLEGCFTGETPRTIELSDETALGRWELRRTGFRQGGQPMTLLVLSDPSRILRQEERQAWRRLIRVLSHEINNSLAPIQSLADSSLKILARDPRPSDWEEDLEDGLRVVATRAEGLRRFMEGYARLARLPQPVLAEVDVRAWVERGVALEPRVEITVESEGTMTISADVAQLDQLLINGLRNAADACLEVHSGPRVDEASIRIGWERDSERFRLWIRDNGPGIANPGNLFVPFFSTKPDGSGIGLALSQQIAEGHEGTLALRNVPARNGEGAGGAELVLELPLKPDIATNRGDATLSG